MSVNDLPSSPAKELRSIYVGQSLSDLPIPALVVDIAKVQHNCKLMLDAVKQLHLGFRAHVKTHKTSELTRYQVGEDCTDVRLVVSTVMEAEQLVPLLLEFQAKGAKTNVLYGMPLVKSAISRLSNVAQRLGRGSVSVMVDNSAHLEALKEFRERTGFPARAFVKTDSGYHRAGLTPLSEEMIDLLGAISQAESKNEVELQGFYSHNSLSYNGSSPNDALQMLKTEIDACMQASQHLSLPRTKPLVISVGDSPSALSIQNLLPGSPESTQTAELLRDILDLVKEDLELEIHAGVYGLLDLQQVAAASRTLKSDPFADIAVTVLAEVCSIYPNRTDKPEALISPGTLAFGREPCKDYPGWALVTPWNMPSEYKTSREQRIIVSRISQEHGILGYEAASIARNPLPLQYGQKLRLWPNHACITMAMFESYFIIDSSSKQESTVIDVWSRWRGW